ncbi:hypothetical protein ZWY2020_054578 [Hordeum vulgare]|nr:hypothetical protein ZWY2020_054578 [Hordeum vulgare]
MVLASINVANHQRVPQGDIWARVVGLMSFRPQRTKHAMRNASVGDDHEFYLSKFKDRVDRTPSLELLTSSLEFLNQVGIKILCLLSKQQQLPNQPPTLPNQPPPQLYCVLFF